MNKQRIEDKPREREEDAMPYRPNDPKQGGGAARQNRGDGTDSGGNGLDDEIPEDVDRVTDREATGDPSSPQGSFWRPEEGRRGEDFMRIVLDPTKGDRKADV